MPNGVRVTDKTRLATIDEIVGIKRQGAVAVGPILFADLEQQLLAGEIGGALEASAAGLVQSKTWTLLSATAGSRVGQPGRVPKQAGTHIDPVSGLAVNNQADYAWTGTAWQWVADYADLSGAVSDITALSDAALKFPAVETGGAAKGPIPLVADRLNKLMGFDAAGKPAVSNIPRDVPTVSVDFLKASDNLQRRALIGAASESSLNSTITALGDTNAALAAQGTAQQKSSDAALLSLGVATISVNLTGDTYTLSWTSMRGNYGAGTFQVINLAGIVVANNNSLTIDLVAGASPFTPVLNAAWTTGLREDIRAGRKLLLLLNIDGMPAGAMADLVRGAILDTAQTKTRSNLIDRSTLDDAGAATPAGIFVADDGAVAGVIRKDGAWHLPALRLGAGSTELTATAEGGVDLGPLAATLIPGTGKILAMLADQANRVGAYLTDDMRWVSADSVARADGVLLFFADEGGRIGGYLTDDFKWVFPSHDVSRNRPETLSAQLADDLTSIRIIGIGDSITWGLTLEDNSPSDPRNGTLSDPRDNLASPSWVNRLRKWLVWAGLGTTATISATTPGRGEARAECGLRPYDDARIIRSGIWGIRSLVGSPYGSVLVLKTGAVMEVHWRGDKLDLLHSITTANPAATASVYVDGVLYGTLAYGGGAASTGNRYPITLAYGDHVVRVVNDSASELHLEQVIHHRLIVVQNDGIIGRKTLNWLPGGLLLNDAMAPGYDWALIQLGTNDGVDLSTAVTEANMRTIVSYCQSRGSKVVLLTANACPPREGGTRTQDMADISGVNGRIAQDLGIAHVDQYRATLMAEIEGTVYLADELHPNNMGHALMARNLITTIANGDI